ncbi:MAG: hypothetical protein GDA48_19390 [Hormoscilla sp. GM102CHS1]|nr:hypothetical protein [Hormoscilla sp. GM102CHS1]
MTEGVVSEGNGKGIGGYRWAGVDSRVDRLSCHNAFPLPDGSTTRATASFEELALSVTWRRSSAGYSPDWIWILLYT